MQWWIVLWSLLLPAPSALSAPASEGHAKGEVRYRGLEALLATFEAQSETAVDRQKRNAIPTAPISAD